MNRTSKKLKDFFIISIGNALEFYDFAIYGFLISTLSELFFPYADKRIKLILATTIFTIGFVARPIGGIIFGYIGDFYGRKKSLEYSTILMGIITLCIGMLPTYSQIGIAAPLFLSFFRILQGIVIGGEYTASIVYLSEHELFKTKRVFYISLNSCFGVSGWFLGVVVVYCCERFLAYDFFWRVPFILGGFLSLVGFYIRRSFKEYYKSSTKEIKKTTFLIKVVRNNASNFCIVILIGAIMGSIFYGQFIFQNVYISNTLKFDQTTTKFFTVSGIAMYMLCLPVMGCIAQYTNYIYMMRFFAFLIFLLNYIIFYLINTAQYFCILASMFLSAFLLAGFFAPASYFMTKLFLNNRKCTGVSTAYNIGATIFGGSVPTMYMLWYEYMEGRWIWVYLPIISICFLLLTRKSLVGLSQHSCEKVL